MFLIISLLLTVILLIAGKYTLKNRTIELFTKKHLHDEEVRNRAIRNVGIFYISSGIGQLLVTILYYVTPMGSQPFVLFFGVFGALAILLRIDLNSY